MTNVKNRFISEYIHLYYIYELERNYLRLNVNRNSHMIIGIIPIKNSILFNKPIDDKHVSIKFYYFNYYFILFIFCYFYFYLRNIQRHPPEQCSSGITHSIHWHSLKRIYKDRGVVIFNHMAQSNSIQIIYGNNEIPSRKNSLTIIDSSESLDSSEASISVIPDGDLFRFSPEKELSDIIDFNEPEGNEQETEFEDPSNMTEHEKIAKGLVKKLDANQTELERRQLNNLQAPICKEFYAMREAVKRKGAIKQHNRDGYRLRLQLYPGIPSNYSPLLHFKQNDTPDMVLKRYCKKHKCKHGLWFNKIQLHSIATKGPLYWSVGCSGHDKICWKKESLSDYVCINCGQLRCFVQNYLFRGSTYMTCKHCKTNIYDRFDRSVTHVEPISIDIPKFYSTKMVTSRPTDKPWNSLFIQKEEIVKKEDDEYIEGELALYKHLNKKFPKGLPFLGEIQNELTERFILPVCMMNNVAHEWFNSRRAVTEFVSKYEPKEDAFKAVANAGLNDFASGIKQVAESFIKDFLTNIISVITELGIFVAGKVGSIFMIGVSDGLKHAFQIGPDTIFGEIITILQHILSIVGQTSSVMMMITEIPFFDWIHMVLEIVTLNTNINIRASTRDLLERIVKYMTIAKVGMKVFAKQVEHYRAIRNDNSISKALAGLLEILGVSAKFVQKNFKSVLMLFNGIINAGRNLNVIFTHMSEFVPSFITDFFGYFVPASKMKKFMDTDYYKNLLPEIIRLHALAEAGNKEQFYELRPKVTKMFSEFEKQIRDENVLSDPLCLNTFMRMQQLARCYLKGSDKTEHPLVILCSGPPGVAKSTLWPAFLMELFPGKKYNDIIDMAYFRNPSSEFFDGLEPHHQICVYDDLNADKEEVDLRELIAMVTAGGYKPPMAELGQKGISFKPKVIVCCSNTNEMNPITLHCAEAINRRFHVKLNFSLCNPKLPLGQSYENVRITLSKDTDGVYRDNVVDIRKIQKVVMKSFLRVNERLTLAEDFCNQFIIDEVIQDDFETPPEEKPQPENVGGFMPEGEFQQWKEYIRRKFWSRDSTSSECDPILGGYLNKLYEAASYVNEFLNKHKKFVLPMAGALAIGSAYAWKQYMLHDSTNPEMHGLINSGEGNTEKRARNVFRSSRNDGLLDNMCSRYMRSIVKIIRADGLCVNGFIISGRTLLVNEHIFHDGDNGWYKGDVSVHYWSGNGPSEYVFNFEIERSEEILNGGEPVDLLLYKLPVVFPIFKDNIAHIFDGQGELQSREISVLRLDKLGHKEVLQSQIQQAPVKVEYELNDKGGPTTILIRNAILGAYESGPGDCGGLVIYRSDGDMKGKIVGIHCASLPDKRSMSTIITRGMIKDTLDILNERIDDGASFRAEKNVGWIRDDVGRNAHEIGGRTLPYGTLKRKVYIPNKTNLKASVLHNKIHPVVTYPATMEKHHLKEGIKKYSGPMVWFDQNLVDIAAASILSDIERYKPTFPRRVLTDIEVINGIDGTDIKSMQLSTSAGFPYALQQVSCKRELLDIVDGKYVLKQKYVSDWQDYQNTIKNGKITDYMWMDYLKDERRKTGKITRIFSSCPMWHIMMSRKYNLAFNTHFISLRCKIFSAIGINKGSLEWDMMLKRLMEVGGTAFDGDYSGWDGSCSKQCMMKVADIMNAWYNDEYQDIRRTLIMETCESLHVAEDLVYQCNGGMPSGDDLTAIANTIVNEIYFRVAWLTLAPTEFKDLSYYKQLVRTTILGDDNVVCVDKIATPFFNGNTFKEFTNKHHLVYTSASKEQFFEFKDVKDCSFLKNVTGMKNGKMVPLMEWSAMLEPLNWYRNSKYIESPYVACEENSNNVLRDLYFYGYDTFTDIRNKILKYEPGFNLLSYKYLDDCFNQNLYLPDPGNHFGFTLRSGMKYPSKEAFQLWLNTAIDMHKQTMVKAGTTQNMDAVKFTGIRNAGGSIKPTSNTPEEPSTSNDMVDGNARIYTTTTTVGQGQVSQGTLDDAQPTLIDSVGTKIENQRANQEVTNNADIQQTNARAEATNADLSWTLRDAASKLHFVSSIEWNVSQTFGQEIASFDVPFNLVKTPIARFPFENFIDSHWSEIVIKIMTVGNRYQMGRLLVTWIPTQVPGGAFNQTYSPQRKTQLGGLQIDPSVSNNGSMTIPWSYFKDWYTYSSSASLGQLVFTVLNPLQVGGSASSTCGIKVFASFKNAQFKIPRRKTFSAIRNAGQVDDIDNITDSEKEDNIDDITDEECGDTDLVSADEAWTGKKNVGFLAAIAPAMIGAVGGIITKLIPQRTKIDSTQRKLDALKVGGNPEHFNNKYIGYLNNRTNLFPIDSMTYDPDFQQITDPSMTGLKDDETTLDFLTKRVKSISQVGIKYSMTNSIGDKLHEEHVGPFPEPLSTSVSTPVPAIDYAAHLFKFWRGGIIYFFDIVATPFHEGRIIVQFSPREDSATTDQIEQNSQYTFNYQIHDGRNCFAIECPFLGDMPWRQVYNGGELGTEPYAGVRQYNTYFAGQMSVYVADVLRGIPDVPSSVQINIYKYGASDFELYYPSPHNRSIFPIQPDPVSKEGKISQVIPEDEEEMFKNPMTGSVYVKVPSTFKATKNSGINGMEPRKFDVNSRTDQIEAVVLGALNSKTYDPPFPQFGEKHTNMVEMCKRFNPIKVKDREVSEEDENNIYFYSFHLPHETGSWADRNMLGAITKCYRNIRGPLRIKWWCRQIDKEPMSTPSYRGYIMPAFDTKQTAVGLQDMLDFFPGNGSISGKSQGPTTVYTDTMTAEFELPFQFQYSSTLLWKDELIPEDTSMYFGFGLMVKHHSSRPTTGTLKADPYIAFGDETALFNFLGTPEVIVIKNGTLPLYPDHW